MTDVSSETVFPSTLASVAGANARTLGAMASDRVTLESFGVLGVSSDTADDAAKIKNALIWSALTQQPVYADHVYNLRTTLEFPAGAALICGPKARFVRNFGGTAPGNGNELVRSVAAGSDPNADAKCILIDGGTWGPEPAGANLGGHVFKLFSSGGVVRNVTLVRSRGIQFRIGGDRFTIHDCVSRDTAEDAGGGLRINTGSGIRCYNLDLSTNDDCYQFNPGNGDVLDDCSIVNCVGKTNQGSLCAFIVGGDGIPNPPVNPETGRLTNCLFDNIRGDTGGSLDFGGYAIKFNCANAAYPIENCWADNIVVRQSSVHRNARSAVHVVVGVGRQMSPDSPGSGVIGSGVRNVTIENRTGPAVQLERVGDSTAMTLSTMIDFTVDGLRSKGPGTAPGTPLIQATVGQRLVLRDVIGDLSDGLPAQGTNPAVDPGRAIEIASGNSAAPFGEVVIDGLEVTNAKLSADGKGLWRFGDAESIRARRLVATPATGSLELGGIEMISTGAGGRGPSWAVFDGVDFRSITRPVVKWINNAGNAIINAIGFDPVPVAVDVPSGSARTITSPSYASVVTVTVRSGGSGVSSVYAMTAPPSGSPERTLILGSGVTITGSGTGANLALGQGGSLTGPNRTITVRWDPGSATWLEVARA